MPLSPAAMKVYQREWAARRYHERRDAFFKNKRCVDCGVAEELQLDHEDPTTKESHRIWSWSKVKREAELAKCVVRCRTCHRQRHRADSARWGGMRGNRGTTVGAGDSQAG